MAHNIDSIAYYGDRPWHGLGTDIPERATASQMITAAGLNWEVAMRPIPNVGAHINKKARRFHVVRLPRNRAEVEVPLGVVSSRYRPLQNSEAFEFFDPIIGDKKAVFETAGSLGNGERVWVLAKVPGEIRVIGDDLCAKYLLLSNAHDGRGSVSVKFTPIRVVCQNTLMLALESGQKAHNVRHSKHMQERLQNVQELLSLTWRTFQRAEELFQLLAKVSVDAERLEAYLEAVYPRTALLKEVQPGFNMSPAYYMLPLGTLVHNMHHSLLEVALVLSLNGETEYHIGFFNTLKPSRCEAFPGELSDLETAIAVADGQMMSSGYGDLSLHHLRYYDINGRPKGVFVFRQRELTRFRLSLISQAVAMHHRAPTLGGWDRETRHFVPYPQRDRVLALLSESRLQA